MPGAARSAIGRYHRVATYIVGMLLAGGCVVADAGRANGAAVRRSEYVTADGAKLYVLVRGSNVHAPVLLWLHGGPGGAERPLFRYFNDALEKHFVVAYWDQRGAGRSFDPHADPKRLTVAQHVADLDVIVDHLRRTLAADKIILTGHSWGAALGLLYARDHPGKVSAVIAVNPLVSRRAAERAEYDFVIEQALHRNDGKTLKEARTIGEPPFETWRDALAFETLVQRYGGIYHHAPRRFWVMCRALLTGLVTPREIWRIIEGNNVSLDAMNQELLGLDLRSAVPRVEVPVSFFLGRYDRHLDAAIAAAYLGDLCAPVKRVVWFEHSAHNVPFEEPTLFNATVVKQLAALGAVPGSGG